jgi:hypothetical protein
MIFALRTIPTGFGKVVTFSGGEWRDPPRAPARFKCMGGVSGPWSAIRERLSTEVRRGEGTKFQALEGRPERGYSNAAAVSYTAGYDDLDLAVARERIRGETIALTPDVDVGLILGPDPRSMSSTVVFHDRRKLRAESEERRRLERWREYPFDALLATPLGELLDDEPVEGSPLAEFLDVTFGEALGMSLRDFGISLPALLPEFFDMRYLTMSLTPIKY